MAKVYTKVGDKGETSLVGGQKVSKDDLRIDAYGTVDELNSVVGVVRAALHDTMKATAATGGPIDSYANLDADLETLQHWLFDLGSLLATFAADRDKYQLPKITAQHVEFFEKRIDAASTQLKPLKTFVLPAGTLLAAQFHVARTVARRAERCMVRAKGEAPEFSIPFINRVSDYLFVMARFCNHLAGVEDVAWKKSTPGN